MANKTVFKGVINGREFDNVSDYNAEMNKLIEENASINATSSTQIINDTECQCENCQCENCQCEKIDYLPYFDCDEHFLDVLIKDNHKDNVSKMSEVDSELYKHAEKIKSKIKDMDKHSLENYLSDVKDVLTLLESDKKLNKDALKQLEKKTTLLIDSNQCIDMFVNFYKSLRGEITKNIDKYQEPTNPQKENTITPEKNNNLTETIRELRESDGFRKLLEALGLKEDNLLNIF